DPGLTADLPSMQPIQNAWNILLRGQLSMSAARASGVLTRHRATTLRSSRCYRQGPSPPLTRARRRLVRERCPLRVVVGCSAIRKDEQTPNPHFPVALGAPQFDSARNIREAPVIDNEVAGTLERNAPHFLSVGEQQAGARVRYVEHARPGRIECKSQCANFARQRHGRK